MATKLQFHKNAVEAVQAREQELLAERDRLKAVNAELVAAGARCLMALAANGAPNCEAAKEMRAAVAKAKGA